MNGRLYIFDGIDGAGKSTLTKALAAELTKGDQRVALLHYPSDRPIGKFIRQCMTQSKLLDPACYMHLFAADAVDCEPQVRKYLDEDYIVLMDRHPIFSAFAYQTDAHAVDAVLNVVSPRFFAAPNATFIMDLPVDAAIKRLEARGGGGDIYENAQAWKMETRRQRYLLLPSLFSNTILLDATQATDKLKDFALGIMKQVDERVYARN